MPAVPDPSFKDHFSKLAAQYAQFRPHYPAALFDLLAQIAPARRCAWDCACGTGQATVDLAARFESVIGTDASAQQIANATSNPRVTYRVAPAERSGIASDSVDLVAVAQALHWFDQVAFYAEVQRVLRADGVLAVWSYGVIHVDEAALDSLLQHFYAHTVGPFWPAERRLVEEGYRSIPFPFARLPTPALAMQEQWSLPQLLGYVRSWSATGRYVTQHNTDPVVQLQEQLEALWGGETTKRMVSWPLTLLFGRSAGTS
jgi:ubiquinone/menaquinone biosynthesis C-methylase UbiE